VKKNQKTAKTELLQLHTNMCEAARCIMLKENRGGSTSDSLANFRCSENIGIPPIQAIVLRMMDKLQRLNALATSEDLSVIEEPAKDACLDLMNYAILAFAFVSESNFTDGEVDDGKSNTDEFKEGDNVRVVEDTHWADKMYHGRNGVVTSPNHDDAGGVGVRLHSHDNISFVFHREAIQKIQ
jgi:ribosomal protein L21E